MTDWLYTTSNPNPKKFQKMTMTTETTHSFFGQHFVGGNILPYTHMSVKIGQKLKLAQTSKLVQLFKMPI